MGRKIKGRGAVGGIAKGFAMVSEETIQGWSGIDEVTGVPTVTDLEENVFELVKTGDYVLVNGDEGYIEILESGEEANG